MGVERFLSCLIAMSSFLCSVDGRATTLTAGGLDLGTAIRLRSALRDIKAKRTKLSPDEFLKPSPHKRRKSGHAGRSESGQSRRFDRLPRTSGFPRKRTSSRAVVCHGDA